MTDRKHSDYAVISLRIKEPLRAKIEKAAKREGISINHWIIDRLGRALQINDMILRHKNILRGLADK